MLLSDRNRYLAFGALLRVVSLSSLLWVGLSWLGPPRELLFWQSSLAEAQESIPFPQADSRDSLESFGDFSESTPARGTYETRKNARTKSAGSGRTQLRRPRNGEPAAPLKDDTEGGGKWAAKADDFLTGHRLVGNKDKFRLMQIYVRKVKETETGGKVSPFTEPVIWEMYGHYGFRSQSGVDPIANFHSRPTQTELPMEEPKKSVTQQPSKTWTDSQSVKEQNENHFETDELDAKNY